MEYSEEQIRNIRVIYSSPEEMERRKVISEAKTYLANTDYVVIKMQEYSITGEKLDKDYTEILRKREEARNILRRMEV